MRNLIAVTVAWALAVMALGADAKADWKRDRPAEELKIRDGIGNFMAKLTAGKDVTIAYIGGSITCGDASWRVKTTKWLREAYPQSKVTEVHAAIGGTDSSLGVFRYDEDVLAKSPDLVLIEFACNDSGLAVPTSRRAMEGMVRKTWRKDPTTDIAFTYVICSYMTNEYCRGVYPRAASVHEEIAENYGIPSVCFGVRVANLCRKDAIVMRAMELTPELRKESASMKFPTEGDYEGQPGPKGAKPVFSVDGVHPTPDGQQLYANCMRDAFKAFAGRHGVNHASRLGKPMFDGGYERAKWFFMPESTLSGKGWKPFAVPAGHEKERLWSWMPEERVPMFRTRTPGDGIRFRFKGSRCGLYGLFGPDGAKLEVTVDGVRGNDICLFDMYCCRYRFCPVTVFEGTDGVHDVEIRVSSETPDKLKLGAPRIKAEDLKDPIYGGMSLVVSRLTMLGELVGEANWIGDGEPTRQGAAFYDDDPAPEFKATFVLPKGAEAADITMACAGYYSINLNGCPAGVTETTLMPLWSPVDHTVYADTFTARTGDGGLKAYPATNVVTVTLGNGFYNLPPLRFWGDICFREEQTHGRPCFRLTVGGVTAPLDWTWRKTIIRKNCVYLGTEVDATMPEDTVWRPAAAVTGPRGRVVPRLAPPIVYRDKVVGKVVKRTESTYVVDFGANLSGVPSFVFTGQSKDDRIEIVYGERLDGEGMVNPLTQTAGQIKWPDRGGPGAPAVAAQRDAYVCSGKGEERFDPPFTWHICRYAEVRGAKAPPRVEFRPVMSDLRRVSPGKDFRSTTSEDLTKLHEVCVRTFCDNLIGVQSDCPGRERLGYGGDIVASCEAMCLNFDMREFYLKTLQDFADEAADDGWITETAPFVGIASDSGVKCSRRAGPVSWTVAVPVLMDTLMRHYPDVTERALSFYPVCARYVRLMDAQFPSGIVPLCIGDHEALERAPNDVTATAHWHEFVRLTAAFAKMLGKGGDAADFEAITRKVKSAFAAKYVKAGIVANGTQSAQAMALYLGLVPEGQVEAAEHRLVEAIEEKDCAPYTGIFSTRYMLDYLSTHGYDALARKLVLHRGFPGWLHMLENGATTLWETWKESDDSYSNCHPMFGSVDEWILKHGVRLERELKEGRVAFKVAKCAPPSPIAATAGILKPLNIVNFARGSWPYAPDYDLTAVMRGQIALNRKYGFASTILLEYSALLNDRVVATAKTSDPKRTAYGLWFEVDRFLADAIGIRWPGKPGWNWDWHTDSAMSFSYPTETRARLVDEAVRRFRETMGEDPKVFGAWMIDAWTMQYVEKNYPCVEAFVICREQDSIDAYDLRGGYYGGGYYPSVRNALSAACNMKNAIRLPCFRMFSTCPIRTWGDMSQKYMAGGCPTNEAMWLLGYDPDGFDWITKTFLAPAGALNFSQYIIGQENTWSWDRIGKPWARQMATLAKWRDEGRCKDETLVETARAFRRKFPANVPQTQVALDDWAGEGAQSAWYNSRFYRCNVYKEGTRVMIRDLHLMCDGFQEEYLRKPCRTTRALQTTLPVYDSFLAGGTFAKGCPVLDGDFASFDVATPDDRTLVVTATRMDGTKAIVTLSESRVEIAGARLVYEERRGTRPFPWTVADGRIDFEYQGVGYCVKVLGAVKSKGDRAYSVLPSGDRIVFDFEE